MKKILISSLFIFNFLFSDAINVSPSTLDFGDVLMGNSPTLTFTITAELQQTVIITAPAFFSVDYTAVQMGIGDSQDIVVTFTPPNIGNYDSYIILTGSVFGGTTVELYANAINDIEGPISGTILEEFSPYEVIGDLFVEEGSQLDIEPGVELRFHEGVSFHVNGELNCNGSSNNLIYFKSNSEFDEWGGINFINTNNAKLEFVVIDGVGKVQLGQDFPEKQYDSNAWTQREFEGDPINFNVTMTSENAYDGENCIKIEQEIPSGYKTGYFDFIYDLKMETGTSYMYLYTKGNSSSSSYMDITLYGRRIGSTESWQSIGQYDNINEESWGSRSFNFNSYWSDGSIIEVKLRVYSYNSTPLYLDNISFSNMSLVADGAINMNQSNINIHNCLIYNNESNGIAAKNNSNTNIINTVIYNNQKFGLESINSSPVFLNSIIWNNSNPINATNGIVSLFNSIAALDNPQCNTCSYNSYTPGGQGYCEDEGYVWIECNWTTENHISLNPMLDDDYSLSFLSPGIDAGHSATSDACLPPGLGSSAADIGMFGGDNNCGTESSNIPSGNPVISSVVDLPQDQGGFVGLQFLASAFDGQHSAYDVDHYSFWRELDESGSAPEGASTNPNESEFLITNRDDYWEHVGNMQAQNFETYGYSAPTLADSTAAGAFWSTFMVIAHTDDDEVYFSSNPATGYSVDNLAPATPTMLSSGLENAEISLTWSGPEDDDFDYFSLFRNGELLLTTTDSTFVDVDFDDSGNQIYELTSQDHNGNISNISQPVTVITFVVGDATGDYLVNVLDVIYTVQYILGDIEDITDQQFLLIDLNSDGVVDILDIIPIVNIILDNNRPE